MAIVNNSGVEENNLLQDSGVLGGYQFQIIAENMKSAILVYDMNKNLTFVNNSFEKITGYKIQELNEDFIKCINPADQSRIQYLWDKIFDNQESTDIEIKFLTKQGIFINLRLFLHALYDKHNTQIGVYIRLVDLSTYKTSTHDYQLLENNIRKAIFSAPFPAVIVSQDGEIKEVNQVWTKLTGYSSQDIFNIKDWIGGLLGNPSEGEQYFSKLIGGLMSDREIDIQTKNGQKRVWQFSSSELGSFSGVGSLYLLMGVDLTARRVAEANLVESEKKLRMITNNLKAVLIAYNNEGNLIYVNPAFETVTGYNISELKIENLANFVYKKDVSKVLAVYKNTLQGYFNHSEDFRIVTKDGEVRWVSSYWNRLKDEDGTQIGIQVRITDITDRKLVQDALKASEANIRAVLNNTSQCFMLVDRDYRVQTFNKIASNFVNRVYGVDLSENLDLKDIISSEDALDFKNCFDFAMQGYPVTIERNIKGKNKKDNWFEMSFTPVYEQTGTIKSVCVGILDISIRKKANQILEASERRFRSLVQNSSDLTCIIDLNQKFKYISPAIKNIFGYKPGKLLYTKYTDYIHPDDLEIFIQAFSKVLSGESAKIEYRFKHKNNEWIYLQSIVSNLISESSVAGVVINARDITETKKTQEDLNESKHFIQRIANSMPNILFLYDTKGYQPIYINQALKGILGYSINDFVGESLADYSDLMHPEDLANRYKIVKTIMNATDDEVIESEFRIRDLHNQWRWLHSWEVVFSREPTGQVRQILGTAEDITRRKSIEDQLAKEAFFDTLTGLPNRRYFIDKLKTAIKKQSEDKNYLFSVLFLDVDRFKIINDSLGHHMGDQLLVAISERLKNAVGENDFVTRLGGDEFTILLDDIKTVSQVIKVVERIQKKLNVTFSLNHLKISVSCSIGIALSTQNYTNPEEVLRDADTAMYRSKNRGRNCYTMFNRQMHDHVLKVLQTEGDLRRAIVNHELEVFYQPIVSLKTGHISSCEALIRWNHPKLGLILPNEFLNVAEETGLMLEVDKFSMFQACKQNADWQNKGLPKIRVAVNLSLNEVRQKKVREMVTSTLIQTKLSPNYLEIELAESVLIEDSESNLETLKELRKMGVGLSIDDFGTGYSSLTYIKRLPSNCLKIDQSFIKDSIRDKGTGAIVKSIISLAHNLNLRVVAEGVETLEQLQFLKDLGCDEAQGYLFGKPMPAAEFEKLLSASQD